MASIDNGNVSKHEDLVEQHSSQPASENPFAHSSNITVSVPETVEVKLVDASVLADYEVWSLVTSIIGSAVVGFLVAYFQADESVKGIYGAVTVVFGLLMVLSGGMAVYKRRALTKNSKKVSFGVGPQIKSGR